MAKASWIGSPGRLAALFVLAAGVPLAAFAWLGLEVLRQQAGLEQERLQSRLTNSATLLAHELDRSLEQWEAVAVAAVQAKAPQPGLPSGAAVVVFGTRGSGLKRTDGVRLPYYPVGHRPAERIHAELLGAQQVEARDRDDAAAVRAYRALSGHPNQEVRAAALVGLARCLVRLGQVPDALAAYERLAAAGATTVGGEPAALVAHKLRLQLFKRTGDSVKAEGERTQLTSALAEGRWPIDRATYDEVVESLQLTIASPGPRVAMADAVLALEPEWSRRPDGRAGIVSGGETLVAVWKTLDDRIGIVVGPVETVLAPLTPAADDLAVTFAIDVNAGSAGTRALSDIDLPWALSIAARPEPPGWLSRRALFDIVVGFMTLVVSGAGYAVYRSVAREMRVAQLQSDFVAAVSHEFRTPLAAVRHLADLLETGAADSTQHPEYSAAIGREARRLQALVENLLDFGRIEEGRRFDLSRTDIVSLTREVADECSDRAAASGHAIRISSPDDTVTVQVDREAVGLALRNLLDNAIKYSPGANVVDVRVTNGPTTVAIAVEDHGVGLPVEEHASVFGKFVRGSAARSLMVKGTGIGLAMADRIIRAHGGSILVASNPGHGSTFTITLPRTDA